MAEVVTHPETTHKMTVSQKNETKCGKIFFELITSVVRNTCKDGLGAPLSQLGTMETWPASGISIVTLKQVGMVDKFLKFFSESFGTTLDIQRTGKLTFNIHHRIEVPTSPAFVAKYETYVTQIVNYRTHEHNELKIEEYKIVPMNEHQYAD